MPTIAESIRLDSKLPNFSRDAVSTLEALRGVSVHAYDIGHIVYCKENSTHYKFKGDGIEFDEVTGYFRKLIDDELNEMVLNNASQIKECNKNITDNISKIDICNQNIEENTSKIEEMWSILFPPAEIIVSIKAIDQNSGLPIPLKNANGDKLKIKLQFSINQGGEPVNPGAALPINDGIIISYNNIRKSLRRDATEYIVEEEISATTKFTVTYNFVEGFTNTSSKSASTTVSFYDYSYYGTVSENTTITEIDINSLTKQLIGSKSLTTTVTLNNQKNCYVYPASFGVLTSIKDDKNYELINSYIFGSIMINGIPYNVYILEYASTVDNYTIKFS